MVEGAEEDNLFGREAVEAVARAHARKATFVPDFGHDMMLNVGWEGVVDRLIWWIREAVSCVHAREVESRA